MEVLTQPKSQTIKFFDRNSRENYFEMLEVALRNLSIVDQKKEYRKVRNRKQASSLSN